MRAVVLTFVGLAALAATSVNAAPITVPAKPQQFELGTAPPIELVRQGCGWDWHRVRWVDRWVTGIGPLRSELVATAPAELD